MIHPRTLIRKYARELVKHHAGGIDVSCDRPQGIFGPELPQINISIDNDSADTYEGDRYVPHSYERTISMVIEIAMEAPVDPDQLTEIQDKLDSIGRLVEFAFGNDLFFVRLQDGYNGDDLSEDGLTAGCTLGDVTPYELVEDGEKLLAVQRIEYEIPYKDNSFTQEKGTTFDSSKFEFRRVGWDDETIDPTLMEAEGDLDG